MVCTLIVLELRLIEKIQGKHGHQTKAHLVRIFGFYPGKEILSYPSYLNPDIIYGLFNDCVKTHIRGVIIKFAKKCY